MQLHRDAQSDKPLSSYQADLAPFDDAYRIPGGRGTNREILFPIHVAVPVVYDTYRRSASLSDDGPDDESPGAKRQTDKGFRGPFIEFFSSDETGETTDFLLIEMLRDLFSDVSGLNALDLALITSLGTRVEAARPHYTDGHTLTTLSRLDQFSEGWRSTFRTYDLTSRGRRAPSIAHFHNLQPKATS